MAPLATPCARQASLDMPIANSTPKAVPSRTPLATQRQHRIRSSHKTPKITAKRPDLAPKLQCIRVEAGRQRDALGTQAGANQVNSRRSHKKVGVPDGDRSLRSQFAELDATPCSRIFLVRKIQKLGLESAGIVEKHFGTHGIIEKVLVSHPEIMSNCQNFVKRIRPSNLAIVVMASEAAAESVHRAGREQCVGGCFVLVEPYERRVAIGHTSAALGHASFASANFDGVSTGDGEGSGATRSNPESDDDQEACIRGDFQYWATDNEEACIRGDFQYWATDDEGFW